MPHAPTDTVPSPETATARPTAAARFTGLWLAARPRQWVKNLACLAGLIFSGRLLDLDAVVRAGMAVVAFCLASSAVYWLNDVCDRRSDRAHPTKRCRPIASGRVPAPWAVVASSLAASAAMALAWRLGRIDTALMAAYLLMNIAYSLRLKHAVLLDVMIIAVGFVLRVLYGVYAVRVLPSPWIALCMFFLALFLGFAKRRGELSAGGAEAEAPTGRPVLRKYKVRVLDTLLAMTATMAVLSYALYTVTGRPGNATLVVTVPLVAYGVLRYLFIVMVHGAGDVPERQLLSDPVTLAIVAAWAGLCAVCLYVFPDAHIFLEH